MPGCITPCVGVRLIALNCQESALMACERGIALIESLCWDNRLGGFALEELSLPVLQRWL